MVLPAGEAAIARAAAILGRGGLVAFPTETVYGLGADARSDDAVASIYAAKERPRFNPLIAHVADLAAATREGLFSGDALRLAEAFWPGPLTLVVPFAPSGTVSRLARAGLDSVALRVPAHPVAQALLRVAGHPVAAPSANRSGRVSPTTAAHVLADLDGRVEMIIDGGACPVGVESTIVSCLGEPMVLRPGGVERERLEAVLGRPVATFEGEGGERPVAPGLLTSHYAPKARLRLRAASVEPGEAALDFGGQLAGGGAPAAYADLSPAGDLREAAARLFAALHELDTSSAGVIAVAPIPEEGLGAAINDRLARAAAPRG